jgi:hypothetical protein
VTSNSGLTLTRANRLLREKTSLDEEAFIVAGYAAVGPPHG